MSHHGRGQCLVDGLLENGQASKYADYFDVEWNPANPALKGKVLAVLGAFGLVLLRKEPN